MMEGVKKSGVKLKDIAERTGVSINTVSHALKDKSDISEVTKRRIKAVAEEMGYIGNAMASSLRSGSTRTVAVILGDISNPHFSIMVKEIEARLMRLGYTLIILNTDERESQEKQAIITALQKSVDGVILCPAPGSGENIGLLQANGTPFVLIGRHLSLDASSVVCDDKNGGYIATRHLLDLGHRNILFLNGPKAISSTRERLEGYKRALAERNRAYEPKWVTEVPILLGAGKNRLDKALNLVPECTAILAFSDLIAWEVVHRLQARGISVPAAVSVVGFDNIQSKYPFPVELTTVSASKTTMSRVSVDLLMDQIESKAKKQQIVLQTKLIVRGSTRRV